MSMAQTQLGDTGPTGHLHSNTASDGQLTGSEALASEPPRPDNRL